MAQCYAFVKEMSADGDGKYNIVCLGADNSQELEAKIELYVAKDYAVATFEEYVNQLKRSEDADKLVPEAEKMVGKDSAV